ncbi:hypothetical protein NDN08_002273 [Rhodosorus marinus]|uniref:FAD-binding domain-containing protein n=1 Tax=Rhodosorus marinus TaxID=101924 RepID=A0AAV8UXD1_9RHOD|nr:hypothetical protein NDN08_002273 [Rhodosorus marinus]
MSSTNGVAGALLKLARSRMTIVSAVTYLCASVLAPVKFRIWGYLAGYLFVFVTQLQTHYLGEYFDRDSDRMNRYSGGLTGGSGALRDSVYEKLALYGGIFLTLLSATIIYTILPAEVRPLALVMLIFANQYSSPPLILNHRALGEITATTISNFLLPTFAYMVQISGQEEFDWWTLWYNYKLLIVPPALLKVCLFLVLNMNDRRADWQGHKTTIPVLLDEANSAKLHLVLSGLAYLAAVVSTDYHRPREIIGMVLVEATFPLSLIISRKLLFEREFRLANMVKLSFLHAPLPVNLLLLNGLVWRAIDWSDAIFPMMMTAIYIYLQASPLLALAVSVESASEQRPPEVEWINEDSKVILVGAGLSGLSMALFLSHMHVPFVVIEERTPEEVLGGACCSLWSPAIKALEEAGLLHHFWEEKSRIISGLEIIDDKNKCSTVSIGDIVGDSNTEGFVLISRSSLIEAMRVLVPRGRIHYGQKLTDLKMEADRVVLKSSTVVEDGESEMEFTGRVVVGCDGAHSVTRKHLFGDEELSFQYEVAHRGEIECSDESSARLKQLMSRSSEDAVLTIKHKHGLEYSAGFLNSEENRIYWFVRQPSLIRAEEMTPFSIEQCVSAWTPALRECFAQTDPALRTVYSIDDAKRLQRLSSDRGVLIGDAAHPVTANMMEGASLSVEDALTLAVLLRDYVAYEDGHVEAFYKFERRRQRYIRAAAVQAKRMMNNRIGSLLPATLVKILPEMPPSESLKRSLRQTKIAQVDDLIARLSDYHTEKQPLLSP